MFNVELIRFPGEQSDYQLKKHGEHNYYEDMKMASEIVLSQGVGHVYLPQSSAISQLVQSDMVMLNSDFTPGEYDVICQRGKDSFEHVGNQRFRKCIDDHLAMYMNATTRQEKSSIVSKIYDEVREKATKPCGGFVKKDLLTRMWFQVSEKEARDKVGQALRDAIKIIRGSGSRKKNQRSNIDESSLDQKRKKARTELYQDELPQLKSAGLSDSSLKMALSAGNRRLDQGPSCANSTRAFLENQVNALGPFPMSSGAMRGWDDMDGSNVKSMLESVIEPLDSFTGQQNVDLAKLNRKRRLSLSQDSLGTGSLPMQQQSNLFDEQMEQIAQKRAIQQMISGNSDFGASVSSVGALRRLSLFGDQLFQDNSQQVASMGGQIDCSTNIQSNTGLLGLSALGGTHNFDFGCDNISAPSALAYRFHSENNDHLQHSHATLPQQQSIWDLEPTPLSGPQQGPNRQRLG